MSTSRALGFGLIALGSVLGGIMVLWLVVTVLGGQTTPGGAVLGLLLAAVLGLPPIGAGLYVLARSGQEAAAAAEFELERRTLEGDRLFRARQARALARIAERIAATRAPGSAALAARIQDLARGAESPGYDQPSWYAAVDSRAIDQQALRRYEDLLETRLERLEDLAARLEHGEAVQDDLRRTVAAWQRDFQQRADLLLGRPAPSVAPTDLLAGPSSLEAPNALAALTVGDAVTRDGVDYLVETSVSYFADGRTWWLHRLTSGQGEAWLYVSPGALSLAWLERVTVDAEAGADRVAWNGTSCRLEASTSAAASVTARGGARSEGTLTIWRYRCDDGRLLWVERWPERTLAYAGRSIKPSELEIWPAERRAASG